MRWGEAIYKEGRSRPFIWRDSATELGLSPPGKPFWENQLQHNWELHTREREVELSVH